MKCALSFHSSIVSLLFSLTGLIKPYKIKVQAVSVTLTLLYSEIDCVKCVCDGGLCSLGDLTGFIPQTSGRTEPLRVAPSVFMHRHNSRKSIKSENMQTEPLCAPPPHTFIKKQSEAAQTRRHRKDPENIKIQRSLTKETKVMKRFRHHEAKCSVSQPTNHGTDCFCHSLSLL